MKKLARLLLLVSIGSTVAPVVQAADAGQTVTFNVGDTSVPAGKGEEVLRAFAPAAAGRGYGAQVESELNAQVSTLALSLETNVLEQLNKLNFVPFVKKMADAGGMVARAMPIDYATKYRVFSLTASAAGAASTTLIQQASTISQDFNNVANGQSPNIGASADVSLMLGINLAAFELPRRGFFDPDRMQLFVSAMRMPYGNTMTDTFSFDVWHVGVHGKYLLLGSRQLANHFDFARWGGLALATGVTYASQDIAFRTDLPGDTETGTYALPQANKTLTINYAYSGTGVVSTHSDIYTIPIEVSSSLQLLYFLTMYAGGALDFTWGSTTLAANAAEPVDVAATDGKQTVTLLSPTPTLQLSAIQSPTAVTARGFFGLQINAGVAALFAQATIDTSDTVGAAAGLRGFW